MSEWSYPFDVTNLSAKPYTLQLAPNESERDSLAARLDLLSLKALQADIQIQKHGHAKAGNRLIHVTGKITAHVEQACVVSLKPVADTIQETFEAWFSDAPPAVPASRKNEELPVPDESEAPEPIENGYIDLGDTVTQFLSLALNPFPKAEQAVYENSVDEVPLDLEGKPSNTDNPFAALKNIGKSGD